MVRCGWRETRRSPEVSGRSSGVVAKEQSAATKPVKPMAYRVRPRASTARACVRGVRASSSSQTRNSDDPSTRANAVRPSSRDRS